MHFRILILLPFLSFLWAACNDKPTQTEEWAYRPLESKLFFTVTDSAEFTNSEGTEIIYKPGLLLATEKVYNCYNFQIITRYVTKGNSLSIDIEGVSTLSGICLAAPDVARQSIPIELNPGTYNLYLVYYDMDQYTLEVTDTSYHVSVTDSSYTRFIPFYKEWYWQFPWDYLEN